MDLRILSKTAPILGAVMWAAACSGGNAASPAAPDTSSTAPEGGAGGDAAGEGGAVLPFQADGPAVYVAKVKNLLTGLAATQQEIDTVAKASDPRGALASLIDGWMKTPQYDAKMLRFF